MSEDWFGRLERLGAVGPLLAVYSDYESDASGAYDVLVGREVAPPSTVPPELVTVEVPSGNYLVFRFRGPLPAAAIDGWRTVWDFFARPGAAARAYTTDLEIYDSAGTGLEIWIAVKRDKVIGMDSTGRDIAGIVAPPPLLYGGGLLLGLLAHHFVPQPFLPPALARALGPILLAAGFIGFAGVWAFHRAGTSPHPWRPAARLVVNGPYRFTRNPMYLGLTLLYLGISCWINALWPMLLLPLVLVVMQRGVIEREEAYLGRRFGEAYREYRARVRRWL